MGWKAKGIAAALALASLFGVAQAQVTITFRFNDPEGPQMRQALDEFERANPDIKVTTQRVTWADAQQQYLREAAVGTAPDVAQLAFVWPRSFGAAGALRSLDDLIKEDGCRRCGVGSVRFARSCDPAPTAKPMRLPVHHRHVCGRLQQGSAQGRRI